ncbi:MAG: hypothetical protein A3J93_03765 [Candidatus Magasanikbacteria bacterium RIFOXYC2_FULL_42_28]|uniref:HTH arsR-type domain-containing protein n=1 Tax=Candidatus Magasanikbacteria bacterium RIFOXYC2_FULL_42_28 TaxID=1798704 RepID=A0A1F6NVF4_9BACT|nr:MAG: hypothetical protein A3J93_03765 [Candidatus Magasanikbacteria bacterium RIFOXYC2_FULL_42_28]
MLEHIIGSTTRLKLLQIFFNAPDRSFFVRELSRLADTQLNGVRRELANFEDIELVKQVEADKTSVDELGTERSKYYRLNPDFYLLEELKALLLKARVLEEQHYVDLIKNRAGEIKLFLLMGRFTGNVGASTDMFIVGKIKPVALAKIIRDFEKFLGQPLRYTLMEAKEYADRREIGDKFLYSVFESRYRVVVDEGMLR